MAKQPAQAKSSESLPSVPNQGGAVAVPSFMQKFAGQGTQNVGAEDIETPRLILIQAVDQERQQTFDVSPGVFFHNALEQDLGKSLRVVPVFVDKRAVLWRPRPPIDQGGILARSDDLQVWNPPNVTFDVRIDKSGRMVKWNTANSVAESRLMEWGSYDPSDPRSQPAATLIYNVALVALDHLELGPMVVSMQRGSIKVARKLLSRLKLTNAPSYGQVFTLSSTLDKGSSGDFFNYKFTGEGFVEDETLFTKLQDTYEAIRRVGLKIKDEEGLQSEGGEPSGADDGPAQGRPAY